MRKSNISRLGLALLCALALGLLMAGSAGAEISGVTADGFEYSIEGDIATITGYIGSETAIIVPKEVGDKKTVRSIGQNSFKENSIIQVIYLPPTISNIDNYAFYGCRNLTVISIPNGVTRISVAAFNNCINLVSVDIPASVTSIGNYAFSGCSKLTSLTIPSSVRVIGDEAFSHCSSLVSLTIPSSVSSIGIGAFFECRALKSISIPSSLYTLGYAAFQNCISLESIVLPNHLSSINKYMFSGCASLTSVHIPQSVTSIGDDAFAGCISLTSLNIPSGVNSIGERSFYRCSSLVSLTIPFSVTFIGQNAFNSTSIKLVVYPGSAAESCATTNSINYELLPVIHLSEIHLSYSLLKLNPGDIVALSCQFMPFDSTIKDVNWLSSNTSVAIVTTDGQVMAVGLGNATITTTAKDGGGASAICSVNVTQPVTSITIEPASASLDTGGTRQLAATISPDNVSDESIQWSSGNTAVATVDNKGLVTAIAPGTTTITATAQDGSGVSGSAEITVNKLQYDMSGVAWNYSEAFTYDGTEKTVILTGSIPEGLELTYQGNSATEAGTYTASVTFTYGTVNYEAPVMPDLTWAIEPAAVSSLPGDATDDGKVDILDLVSIIDYIVSITSPASQTNADANGDGSVDILDLVWIIDQIVGG